MAKIYFYIKKESRALLEVLELGRQEAFIGHCIKWHLARKDILGSFYLAFSMYKIAVFA